jgi:hypothetical protein
MAQWSCKRRDICVQLSRPFGDVIGAIFRDEQSDFGLIALGVNGGFGADLRGIGEMGQESKIKASVPLACKVCLHIVISV